MLYRLRYAALAAPALAIALAVAGCGGGSASAGAAATTTTAGPATKEAAARRFAQCARQNGIPNLQDPTVDAQGNVQLTPPPGLNEQSPQAQHVIQVCGHYLEGVFTNKRANKQQRQDALLRFSRCMRQHGLPGFPDPNFSQDPALPLKTMNTADQTFQHAMAACRSLLQNAGVG